VTWLKGIQLSDLGSLELIPGLVIRTQSGFYEVFTEMGIFTCQLRGKFKKGPRIGDVIAVGDKVKISPIDGNVGMIEHLEPRSRMFSRMAPLPQGEYQQVLIANPDQVVMVFACTEPAPRLGMLDRFLVICEKADIPALIIVNKIDLLDNRQVDEMFAPYHALSYLIIYTSAQTGQGLDELHKQLVGKISLFTGPSGVGKSSLLNAIQPGLGLAVKEISQSTSKGRHTTVVREMFHLMDGGWVADTPGLKALALWDIEPEEIDAYFPELRSLVAHCSFSDCTHQHEPGCAVIDAVEEGKVSLLRYQSYLRMRLGEED
jgi:ribosome biogenesis GTPase